MLNHPLTTIKKKPRKASVRTTTVYRPLSPNGTQPQIESFKDRVFDAWISLSKGMVEDGASRALMHLYLDRLTLPKQPKTSQPSKS